MKCDFCKKSMSKKDVLFIYKNTNVICNDCVSSLEINYLTFIPDKETAIKELESELTYYNAMVNEYKSNLDKTPKNEFAFIDLYSTYVNHYKNKVYQTEILLKKLKG